MRHRAHVAHRSPGRIRLKVPDARGNQHFFDEVRKTASGIKKVDSVETNAATGSIVIRHHETDPDAMTERLKAYSGSQQLLSLAFPELDKAEQVESVIESDAELLASHSRVASAMVDALRSLNLRIKRATGNTVDLNLLLPLGVAAYAGLGTDLKKQGPLWAMLVLLSMHTFANVQHADQRTS